MASTTGPWNTWLLKSGSKVRHGRLLRASKEVDFRPGFPERGRLTMKERWSVGGLLAGAEWPELRAACPSGFHALAGVPFWHKAVASQTDRSCTLGVGSE